MLYAMLVEALRKAIFVLSSSICLFVLFFVFLKSVCSKKWAVPDIEINICDICEQSEIIKEFSRHTKISSEAYAQVVSDAAYLKNKMDSMITSQMLYHWATPA